MRSLRSWVAARPVLAFYLLTLLFSWSYWLALLSQGRRVGPGSSATHLPGLMGPLIAAAVVAAGVSGRRGLRGLLRSALVLPRPRLRNAMLALSPLVIGAVVFAILGAAGAPRLSLRAFNSYPGLPEDLPLPLLFLFALVLNGYGEEVGWRGFATERLAPRLGRIKATLLVAAMWMVWHIPLFRLNAGMQALVGPVIIGWAFGLLCGAFALAGVYLASGHSILVAAFWHTFYNFTVATEAGAGAPAAVISAVVMAWGIHFAYAWRRDARNERAARPPVKQQPDGGTPHPASR